MADAAVQHRMLMREIVSLVWKFCRLDLASVPWNYGLDSLPPATQVPEMASLRPLPLLRSKLKSLGVGSESPFLPYALKLELEGTDGVRVRRYGALGTPQSLDGTSASTQYISIGADLAADGRPDRHITSSIAETLRV